MAVHHTVIKSLLKNLSGVEGDALLQALKADNHNFNDAEIEEILAAFGKERGKQNEPESTVKADSPNAKLLEQLAQFNYAELRGDEFKKYCLLVQTLNNNTKFDFELYKVEVLKKVRFKGIKDSPVDIIGIRIKDNKPKSTTRITTKQALIQNGTVKTFKDEDTGDDEKFFELSGSQVDQRGNELFYLLKK